MRKLLLILLLLFPVHGAWAVKLVCTTNDEHLEAYTVDTDLETFDGWESEFTYSADVYKFNRRIPPDATKEKGYLDIFITINRYNGSFQYASFGYSPKKQKSETVAWSTGTCVKAVKKF